MVFLNQQLFGITNQYQDDITTTRGVIFEWHLLETTSISHVLCMMSVAQSPSAVHCPFSSYQCDKKLRNRLPCLGLSHHSAGARKHSLSAPTFPTEKRDKAEMTYLHLWISRCNIEPEFTPNISETQTLNLNCWFPLYPSTPK